MNILGFLEKKTREALQDISYQEQPLGHQSRGKSSGELYDCSRLLADVSNASGTASTSSQDGSVKKTSKKKKKKGKLNKLHLNNNIAPEIVGESVVSHPLGQTECDLNNATTFSQTIDEVIGKSLHDRIDAKLDSLSLEIAMFSTDEENNTEKAVGVSSIVTSVPVSDTKTVFSTPPLTDNSSIEICEQGSKGVSFGTEESSNNQIDITADCNNCTRRNLEPPRSRSLSADLTKPCHGSSHTYLGVNEADSNQCAVFSDSTAILSFENSLGAKDSEVKDSKVEVRTVGRYSGVREICMDGPTQNSKHNEGSSQMSFSRPRLSSSMNSWKKIGKENAQVTWQRTGRFIGSSLTDSSRVKSDCCVDAVVSSDTSSSSLKSSSSEGSSLICPPHFTQFSTDGFRHEEKCGGRMMPETREHKSADASEWARNGEYISRPREEDVMVGCSWERLKNKSNLPSKTLNASHGRKESKGIGVSKTNQPGTRYNLVKTEVSEIPNMEYLDRYCFTGQKTNICHHEYKSKISENRRVESMPSLSGSLGKPESFYASSVEEDKASVCSEIELPYNGIQRQYFPPGTSSYKWVPVDKKESTSKISTEIDHTMVIKVKHDEELVNDVHSYNCLSGGQRIIGHDQNDYCSASGYKSNSIRTYICSDLAVQALDASYRLQIAAESFQLASGNHVAEFEKLLYLVSPVITSSFLQQHSDKVFSKSLRPKIALQDVWNWYEGPGNYGLQVNTYDSKKSNGLEANASFHFIPFLSAIQLFDHPQHSLGSSFGNASGGVVVTENTDNSFCTSTSVDLPSAESAAETCSLDIFSPNKQMRQCGIATHDENGSTSDDSQVIFEYFEKEPPHQRKPLFLKMQDLLEVDASKTQLFGDPSRLECMDAQDLHPSSWYSVAWYPIYRIPEGCFRASFLTYHSLGHLFAGRSRSDSVHRNEFSAVFPALGMQSYSAEGECWFQCKSPPESLLNGCKLSDVSKFFKKRLKTLEETAALFSRGNVRKEHVSATNRHPDYEFFLSRKQ